MKGCTIFSTCLALRRAQRIECELSEAEEAKDELGHLTHTPPPLFPAGKATKTRELLTDFDDVPLPSPLLIHSLPCSTFFSSLFLTFDTCLDLTMATNTSSLGWLSPLTKQS